MWEALFSKDSLKQLEVLDKEIASILKSKIKNLLNWLNNTEELAIDFKKLHGRWKDFYRIKAGRIRVLISLDKSKKQIKIHDIEFRGDIYKK
jgi:mRNA-degrading endonuclease RelE of RelBE toxin-antitoxin system